jgi:Fe2+ or Zn2+ uptake regulation protein
LLRKTIIGARESRPPLELTSLNANEIADHATNEEELWNADAPRINNASTVDTAVGTRPTRQRLTLARLLFEQGDRHVAAEQLHGEAVEAAVRVSLATVYNTLHQFIEAGLLREVVVNSGHSYFDTNVSDHHHFFFEDTDRPSTFRGSMSKSPACRSRPRAPPSAAST